MGGAGGLFDGAGVLAGHAGDRFDAGFDVAGEAALLVGGGGDGVQSVADFGNRTIGCLQDVGNR